MATSFDQIVQRVKQQLLGYTRNQANLSYLVATMTAGDTQFQADPDTVRNLSRGIVEIDDEMIIVKSLDQGTGMVTVFGGGSGTGRGAEGTTPAAHGLDSLITADPRYPKARIKEAINDTISGIYPDIWVFGETEFPYIAARSEYPVPAEVEDIYKVTTNTVGPSGMWMAAQRYRFNPQASTTVGQVLPTPTPTGKTVQILDWGITPGRNIHVVYTKAPSELVNGGDDFATTTGLPERMLDLITFGACWRLLPAWEAGRLQQSSVESTERAPLVPTGAANEASQYYLGLYQRRLNEERDRLLDLYPNFQYFTS
jgi:hypothetical protein